MLLFAEYAHRSFLLSSFGATVFCQMARLIESHLSLWLLFQRLLESVWRPQVERRSLDTFYSSYHTGCLWSCLSLSGDFQPSLSLARLGLWIEASSRGESQTCLHPRTDVSERLYSFHIWTSRSHRFACHWLHRSSQLAMSSGRPGKRGFLAWASCIAYLSEI